MRKSVPIMLSGAAILCLAVGLARSYGMFLKPVTADLGVGRAAFALAVALQQVVWGLAQPVAGMISDRFGAARVLSVGGLLYGAGLVMMSSATSSASLALSVGLVVGLGLSATSFSVVLGAVGRLVPAGKRNLALTVASTGGSLGQFVVFPLTGALLAATSWSRAVLVLGASLALVLPLSWLLQGKVDGAEPGPAPGDATSLSQALRAALRHPGYLYLVAGFSVCGFHVAFISSHLPAYLSDNGLGNLGMTSMGVVGFFNVLGTYLWGIAGGRYRKKHLLAGLYAARGLTIALFLALPLTSTSVFLFSAAMGMLWLGTIPLTSGLLAQLFGTRYMSTLFGGVFLGHQVGAFLGVWLGGYLFDALHSYSLTWQLAIALSFVAVLIHLRILDGPERARPPEAAVATP